MVGPSYHDIATRYAGFLTAIHQSLDVAPDRAMPLAQHAARLWAGKPARTVLKHALTMSREPDGLILEFGVFKGRSLCYLAALKPANACHGFDSFQGFPTDGRKDWALDLSVEALPRMPDNVTLHPGFFAQTVPAFLEGWTRPRIALIHIDCDIFSAADEVLQAICPHLRAGDVLVFDELLHYAEFAVNEAFALYRMLERTGLDFEWLRPLGRAYPFAERKGRMLDKPGFNPYRAAAYYQNHAIRLTSRGRHFDQGADQTTITHVEAQLRAAFPSGIPPIPAVSS